MLEYEDLNIETKEDSIEKIAQSNGKPRKFFLFATEINLIVTWINLFKNWVVLNIQLARTELNFDAVLENGNFTNKTISFENVYPIEVIHQFGVASIGANYNELLFQGVGNNSMKIKAIGNSLLIAPATSNYETISTREWTNSALNLKETLSNKGEPNGYAPLDNTSKIPSVYLPAFVDDVMEFSTIASLPAIGESGKIYITLDTNLEYRWSGTTYINIAKGDVQSVNSKTGLITLNTDDISESGTATNKWWTNSRTLLSTLTNYVKGSGTISASDTVISAIQKLDGNLDSKSSIHYEDYTSTSVTNNAAQAVLKSINLPANLYKDNISVNWDFTLLKDSSTSVKFILWINTSNSLTGATNIGEYTCTAANKNLQYCREIIFSGGKLNIYGAVNAISNKSSAQGAGEINYTYNYSQQYYLIVTCLNIDTATTSSFKKFKSYS